MWKSGICWCNDDGIIAHLELAENGQSLFLKMHTVDTVRPEGLMHRSRIVSTIRETVESFGRVNVIESVIDPDEVVKHPPLKNPAL